MAQNTLPVGTVVSVTKKGDTYLATTPDGTDVTDQFETYQLRNAVNEGSALKSQETADNKIQWRKVPVSEFKEQAKAQVAGADPKADHDKLVNFLSGVAAIRPKNYKMADVNWRFAVRTVLRGKNMMIVGPKGTGKTVLAFTLRDTLERPFFNIPLGATQDPQSTLIGNVHYSPEKGTYLSESELVRAIQTPDAIILLDEITRAHPDAWNILMPVLDYKQRFLRIDTAPGSPTIPVAEGVTFIATANIGSQYTATRTLDSALMDRFVMVEVHYMDKTQEYELLKDLMPGVADNLVNAIAAAAADIRKEATGTDPRLSDGLSTRNTIEWAELIYDGFSFTEAADLAVYPQFSEAGGAESERAIVKMIIQKHVPPAPNGKQAPFNLDPNGEQLPWE